MQQQPLSLLQFQKKFGTEKACQKQLFRMRWPEGFKCPRCGHTEAYFHSKRRLYQCKSCNYQASLTAGTVFHRLNPQARQHHFRSWKGSSIRSKRDVIRLYESLAVLALYSRPDALL